MPPPSQELFEKMGTVMESSFKTHLVLNMDIEPEVLLKKSPDFMKEAWSIVARTSYKYLCLASGAEVEDIG